MFASHYNYWIVVILMMMGLYAVFSSGNLVKRLVGLSVFQTSVFLLYISIGKAAGGIPPILPETHHGEGHGGDGHGADGHDADHGAPVLRDSVGGDHDAAAAHDSDAHGAHAHGDGAHADGAHGESALTDQVMFDASALDAVYSNPLPHVLILTAIVVGVATLSVGLALVVRIRDAYGSIEDEDINRAEYETEVEEAQAGAVEPGFASAGGSAP